jgi:NitT/TauT family transport system substrate-binding protein
LAAIAPVPVATPGSSAAPDQVRLGVLPVVDTLPLMAGQKRGFFAEEEIELTLVTFQSALERDAALQTETLDGYFGDILNTILLIHSGQKVRIITTVFHTHDHFRMFGIATSPESGITDLGGLKGRQVAISRATIIEYLLDRLLGANGYGPGHVEKLEIKKMPIRLQMLLSNRVAAALLPEPLLTLAQANGATVILDDRGLDTSETVLALNTRATRADPLLAVRFLRAYRKAVAAVNADPEVFKEMMITRTRFPMPVKDRYAVPQFPEPGLPSKKDIADVQDWITKNGISTAVLPYDHIVLRPAP